MFSLYEFQVNVPNMKSPNSCHCFSTYSHPVDSWEPLNVFVALMTPYLYCSGHAASLPDC